MTSRFLIAATLLLAACHGAPKEALAVRDGWLRATPPGSTVAAAYFTLHNGGSTPVKIVAIDSPLAAQAQLHSMSMDGGMMQMREIPLPFELAPGAELVLSPEGNHLMLENLKAPIAAGATGEVNLHFADGRSQTLRLPAKTEGDG